MHFASYYRWLVFRKLFQMPPSYNTLLDVGCDDGGFIQNARMKWGVALDKSQSSLRSIGSLDRVCADGTRMPFGPGSFDWVIASDVIEHVPDDRAFVTELATTVKNGGTVWLSTTASRFSLIIPVVTARAERAWGHVRSGYRPEVLVQMFGSGAACEVIEWSEPCFRLLYALMWVLSKRLPVMANNVARLCFLFDAHLSTVDRERGHLYVRAVTARTDNRQSERGRLAPHQ